MPDIFRYLNIMLSYTFFCFHIAGFKTSIALEDDVTNATVMKAHRHIIDLFLSIQISKPSELSVSKKKIFLVQES